MRKNELIRQLQLIEGNYIIYVPDYDDPCNTKEAKTIGISSVPSQKYIEPHIIIDFE